MVFIQSLAVTRARMCKNRMHDGGNGCIFFPTFANPQCPFTCFISCMINFHIKIFWKHCYRHCISVRDFIPFHFSLSFLTFISHFHFSLSFHTFISHFHFSLSFLTFISHFHFSHEGPIILNLLADSCIYLYYLLMCMLVYPDLCRLCIWRNHVGMRLLTCYKHTNPIIIHKRLYSFSGKTPSTTGKYQRSLQCRLFVVVFAKFHSR